MIGLFLPVRLGLRWFAASCRCFRSFPCCAVTSAFFRDWVAEEVSLNQFGERRKFKVSFGSFEKQKKVCKGFKTSTNQRSWPKVTSWLKTFTSRENSHLCTQTLKFTLLLTSDEVKNGMNSSRYPGSTATPDHHITTTVLYTWCLIFCRKQTSRSGLFRFRLGLLNLPVNVLDFLWSDCSLCEATVISLLGRFCWRSAGFSFK